jgi:4-hydroxymandelate oxidase
MTPSTPVNLTEFEAFAQGKVSEATFGYYVSGANDEITLRENRSAFDRIKLLPHVLRDISNRNMTTTILGHTFPTPVFIAPMATQRLAHPDGELGMVRGAGQHGVGMILSTMSTCKIEDIAEARSAPTWFQLYVYKDRWVSEGLVKRAEAAGYSALVLTVDTPFLGRRERDVRNRYAPPLGYEPVNLPLENLSALNANNESNFAEFMRTKMRADDMTWEAVAWLKTITNMPIFLKGILRADDAAAAVQAGADGIIVSNHGGRQLDTVPATIEVLPEVAAAVQGRVPILMDGGVRRGTDVIKAIALGAQGVLIGRPMIWALAYDGEAGVSYALKLLLDEIDLAMALCGCASLSDMTRDLVRLP